MAQIDRIVRTFIDEQTAQITIRSFDIPLLLAKFKEDDYPDFNGSVMKFTDLDSVNDVFKDLDASAYKMARSLLSSTTAPSEFYIGRVTEADDPSDNQTYSEALFEASFEGADWYVVLIDSKDKADILDVANTVEAMNKLFVAATADEDVPTTATSDIASELSEKKMDRTALIYSEKAAEEHPDAAWVGQCITAVAGSNSWEYKTLNGVTRSKLRDNQISILEGKNCNYYIRVLGADITRKGYLSSGDWIDSRILTDWINARFQERIFFRKKNLPKIPMTDSGIAIIELEMRDVLSEAQSNGGVAEFDVRAPRALGIPEIERARRNADGFRWVARYAGAISTTTLRGVVHY